MSNDEILEPPPGWTQTYSGRAATPLHMQESQVSIVDVVHALSMKCRFGGHSRVFYSVAQHVVLVARIAALATHAESGGAEFARTLPVLVENGRPIVDHRGKVYTDHRAYELICLEPLISAILCTDQGLHHDDPEYVLPDMPTPVKKQIPAYKEAEHDAEQVIFSALGVPLMNDGDHALIKRADTAALFVERRHLLRHQMPFWGDKIPRDYAHSLAAELCVSRFEPLGLEWRQARALLARAVLMRQHAEHMMRRLSQDEIAELEEFVKEGAAWQTIRK